MDQLDDALHTRIKLLAANGDQHLDARRCAEAISNFEQALALLPHPVHKWDAATWLFVAIGDAAFQPGASIRPYPALDAMSQVRMAGRFHLTNL